MNELTPTAAAAISTAAPAQDFNRLFAAYIAFIDRSEKTAQTYTKNLRQFAAYLHYRGIEAPTREDIIAYRDYLLSEHEAVLLTP